jgi:O-antigen/teichoic acid export membrane protein
MTTDSNATTKEATPAAGLGRIGKHTLVYALGLLLNRAVAFVMLPLYTRYLAPADYGTLQLIGMTTDAISIVAGARLAEGLYYFYHREQHDEARRTFVSTALILLFCTYAVASALMALFAHQISSLLFHTDSKALLVQVAAASFAFEGAMIVPMVYLQIRDRSSAFVAVNAVKLLLQLSLNVLFLVHYGLGPLGILLGTLTAHCLTGLLLAAHTFRQTGVHFRGPVARALLRFGVPLMGTQIATFFATFGDRYFLQAYGGEAVVGLYSLSYQFGFLLATVGFLPFNSVWQGARFAIAKLPNRDALFSRGFLIANLLLISMAVGIALFVRDGLQVLVAPAYLSAARVVPLILVAYALQCWTDFQNIGIYVKERTSYITIANWVCAGVCLVGYAVLIPRYLEWGAAVTTVVAFAVRQVLVLHFSQRLWPVRYDWTPIVRIVAMGVGVCLLGWVIPRHGLVSSIALRSVLFAFYAAGVWRFVLGEPDRVRLRLLLRRPSSARELLTG